MSIIFVSLLISCYVSVVLSECGKCNEESSVACISETSFQYCFEDTPDESKTVDCPKGYNCVLSAAICSKTGTPGCISKHGKCGKCDPKKRFACMSETTFALCLGTDKPSNITNECPTDKVCSIEFPKFCATASETAIASCGPNEVAPIEPAETPGGGGENPNEVAPSEPPETPGGGGENPNEVAPTEPPKTRGGRGETPNEVAPTKPQETPSEVCLKDGKRGKHAVDGDPTCKKYILCSYRKKHLVVKEVSCPGNKLFDPKKKYCVLPKTMKCQPKA